MKFRNQNKTFNVPDWTQRNECQPFLNKKVNEYWITIEKDTPMVLSDFDDARREGLSLLLEYYGKKFDVALVNRLMYLGGTAYNVDFQLVGEDDTLNLENSQRTGLFSYVENC